MPVIQQDVSSWYYLTMKMKSQGDKSWSEFYIMKNSGFATVTADAKCLALWRAALLGRDVRLDVAVVVQKGPAKTSRFALVNPVFGSTGVKFDETLTRESATRMNTSGDGLQLRFETTANRHADRMLKGMPDGWINAEKYNSDLPPTDQVDFGDYTVSMANTELPGTLIYEFAKSPAYTSTQLSNNFVNYETALKKFFKAVYNFTTSRYKEIVDNVWTGNYTPDAWRAFIYRYASSRTVGDPF